MPPTNPRTLVGGDAGGDADFHVVSARGRLIRFPRAPIGEAQGSVSRADGLEGEQLNFVDAGNCAARRLSVLLGQSQERRYSRDGPRIPCTRPGLSADNQDIVYADPHVLAILRFRHDDTARSAAHRVCGPRDGVELR